MAATYATRPSAHELPAVSELPTVDALPEDDAQAAYLTMRSRRLRLPALCAGAIRSVSFGWQASPRWALLSMTVGVAMAATSAYLYIVLRQSMPRLLRIESLADLLRPGQAMLLLAVAGVLALRLVLRGFNEYARWRLQNAVYHAMDMAILRTAVTVPLATFEDSRFYPLLQRCMNAIPEVSQAIPMTLQTAADVVTIVAITSVLSSISGWIAVAAAAAAAPAVITQIWSAGIFYRAQVANSWLARLRYVLSTTGQDRWAAAEIRAFDLSSTLISWSETAWSHMTRRLVTARLARIRLSALASACSGVVLFLGAVATLAGGSRGVGAILTAVIGLLQIRGLFGQVFSKTSTVSSVSRYLRDLDTLSSGWSAPTPVAPEHDASTPGRLNTLQLHNVSFRYPDSTREALHDVCLTLRRGELVAIVGKNGSGKTTLAKLMAGLYAPTAGAITWNGCDYHQVLPTVRARTTIQFQDATRWPFTVAENLWFGDTRSAPEEARLRASLAAAGADTYIDALPKGIATRLGRELGPGEDLSGGQWQRLALARCFYRDADIVIMDEATSAMDAHAESTFLDSIRTLLTDRTAVLITHRFSHLELADRIIVLEDGHIAETGSHADLVTRGGPYAQLHHLQLHNR